MEKKTHKVYRLKAGLSATEIVKLWQNGFISRECKTEQGWQHSLTREGVRCAHKYPEYFEEMKPVKLNLIPNNNEK